MSPPPQPDSNTMKMNLPSHIRLRSRRSGVGAALIVVLCFMVLLTVVVVAMLSHAIFSGLISNASSNVTKTDLYAHGAIDQVIGDLRQEIVSGSSNYTVVTGSVSSTLYRVPAVSASVSNAVPYPAGPYSVGSANWSNLPNLVKESYHGVAFEPYDSVVPIRAVAAPATTPSRNGRYVSWSTWNEALLLPKLSATVTIGTSTGTTISEASPTTDTTPNTNTGYFSVPPDWILTTADGSNPTSATLDTSSSLTTSNVNPKSPRYIVGRYAYTIYNEGGLLDANAAGCPGSATTGLSSQQQTFLSKKGPEAFADLTQVPGIATLSTVTGGSRPQQVVDQLISWRNYATTQPTGSFPLYTFGSVGNYFNDIVGPTTRFMTTGNTSLYNNLGDRLFTSRQQLVSFLQDVAQNATEKAYLQDAMMYLGTFSRALNQPSYWPDQTRPRIVSAAATATSSTPTTPVTYTGGNNAFGKDDQYNPPFRSIRVTNGGWTRNDGTTAVTGEPLVKKRFALNRLAWLTCKGPIADDNGNLNPNGDATIAAIISYLEGPAVGLSAQFLSEGGPTNIYNSFGLTWTSGTYGGSNSGNVTPTTVSYWVYNHGANGSGKLVGLLSDANAAGREPDFFELLQASVNAGCLARACTGQSAIQSMTPYVPIWDSQVDFHILQLGANIIDETNPTQYPTHIETSPAFGPPSTALAAGPYRFFGRQDLPYLNSTHSIAFVVTPPSSGLAQGAAPVTPALSLTSGNQGQGALMIAPAVWNPYDVSTPAAIAGPANLRITALGGSPLTKNAYDSTSYFSIMHLKALNISIAGYSQNNVGGPTYIFPSSDPWTTDNSAALYFSNPTPGGGSTLYREPTLLLQSNLPAGSNLAAASSGSYLSSTFSTSYGVESGSNAKLVGFLIGTFPLQFDGTISIVTGSGSSATTKSVAYTFNVNQIYQAAPANGYTLRMEYQDAAGNWVPYQEYFEAQENDTLGVVPFVSSSTTYQYVLQPNPGTSSNKALWNFSSDGNGYSGPLSDYTWDPRTPRWGMPNDMRSVATSFLDTTSTTMQTIQPGTVPGPTGPGSESHGDLAPYFYFYPVSVTAPVLFSGVQQNIASQPVYYPDADGVVRRAMGGHQTTTSSAGVPVGLPLATVYNPTSGTSTTTVSNRPIILHRPFRSVAELGYVFSDTPWRNIDFAAPESGFAALLDTFCIAEDKRPDAVGAGYVDLNTRQAPVLQALLSGAYRDEIGIAASVDLTQSEAILISQDLVNRTTVGVRNRQLSPSLSGAQPLSNIGDLVGRWISGSTTTSPITGYNVYDGLTADFGNLSPSLYTGGTDSQNNPNSVIQRFRETALRAFSDAGQAGTWNLLIDVVAQSGRYPANAAGPSDFLVEGERHYWVHVAIDRESDQVIDESIEPVND